MNPTIKKALSGLEYTFAPDYVFSNTKYVAAHHTGGLGQNQFASSKNLTAEKVSEGHYDRWQFPSQFMKQPDGRPWYGGYNFYFERDGRRTQFRALGEETAAQFGYNFKGLAISMCFAGNFMKDKYTPGVLVDGGPTIAQKKAAWQTYQDLAWLGVSVDPANMLPHWYFQTTQCYGSGLTIDFIRNLLTGPNPEGVPVPAPAAPPDIQKLSLTLLILQLRLKILDLMRQIQMQQKVGALGGVVPDCREVNVRG